MTEPFDLRPDPDPSPDPTIDPATPAAGNEPAPRHRSSHRASTAQVSNAPSGSHLSDHLKVLYKRRWPALAAFVIIAGSIILYTFTSTPIYSAQVQILIEKESTNVVAFKEAIEQNKATDDYYQTQYKILQSRALARKTLDALKLWNHPEFSGSAKPGLKAFIKSPIATMSTWFGPSAAPAPAADESRAESAAIDRFLTHVTIAPVRNSRLVIVTFESPDPLLSANVANALSSAYIEQNLEYKFLSSREATDFLTKQLGEQRQLVEASEQAVQHYREQTDSLSLEDKQNIVVQKLSDLNAAVTRAKTERIQKEAAYLQMKAVQGNPAALDTIPAIISNTFLQQQKSELADLQRQEAQMAERLGPSHPDRVRLASAIRNVEAKIQSEVGKIMQSMQNDYQQTQAQEESLTRALDEQKRDALALNRKGIEYGVLQRDAASNRQIFDSLLQRMKETGITGELRTNNIRVVDAAEVPRSPSSPNTRNNLLIAVFGGLTIAVGLAFLLEYLDDRIKSPDEMKQYLGLPFLGMLPALFDKTIETPLIGFNAPNNFSESFRNIRTHLLFSTTDEGARSVVVTSAGPGEGKTAVSCNLAVALAQSGQRVLIVDADMRRPRVHTVFTLNREPGLSNVLVGDSKASEAVKAVPSVSGLWVLPAGVLPPNPAELLGSKRFKDFLSSLMTHFDWVIIDTPPVMAVTDSSVVAHLATGVLFVVAAEITSRHSALRALDQLQQARAHFFGAVLNRVDLQHNPYYYSQYYRREYADYYTSANK